MIMIDWTSARISCDHHREIAGGAMVNYKNAFDFDAGADWFYTKPLPVVGSHDANVRIKTSGYDAHDEDRGKELHIDGNLVKFFQGHNLWGSHDVVGLVSAFMDHLCTIPELGLCPTDLQRQMWRNGAFNLNRVDVTTMYSLDNLQDVLSWISSAELSATMRHRGRGQLTKGSSLYFGKHSRRWSLKFYSKGQEITAKGHELPETLPDRKKLIEYAQPALRSELTLRAMHLNDNNLQLAANWPRNAEGIAHLFMSYLDGLNMSDVRALSAEVLEGLPAACQLAYQAWLDGHDLKAKLAKNTFYRYRRQLLPHGVDLAIVNHRERSNVVPLVRVLEAKPMQVPDWAIDTPLFFDPSKKRQA